MDPKGGLGGLPTPLVVLFAGILPRTLLLLPASQKWQLGFWSFCILLSIICPNCTGMQLFLVPYSFFVSIAGGDSCPGASPPIKGPRSQPASLLEVFGYVDKSEKYPTLINMIY